MALDTANKRMSALNAGNTAFMLSAVPDSTIDQADRQSLAYTYSGILAIAPVAIVSTSASMTQRLRGDMRLSRR